MTVDSGTAASFLRKSSADQRRHISFTRRWLPPELHHITSQNEATVLARQRQREVVLPVKLNAAQLLRQRNATSSGSVTRTG